VKGLEGARVGAMGERVSSRRLETVGGSQAPPIACGTPPPNTVDRVAKKKQLDKQPNCPRPLKSQLCLNLRTALLTARVSVSIAATQRPELKASGPMRPKPDTTPVNLIPWLVCQSRGALAMFGTPRPI
jgi:hypothetical protein